jgi:hypothetical protein
MRKNEDHSCGTGQNVINNHNSQILAKLTYQTQLFVITEEKPKFFVLFSGIYFAGNIDE